MDEPAPCTVASRTLDRRISGPRYSSRPLERDRRILHGVPVSPTRPGAFGGAPIVAFGRSISCLGRSRTHRSRTVSERRRSLWLVCEGSNRLCATLVQSVIQADPARRLIPVGGMPANRRSNPRYRQTLRSRRRPGGRFSLLVVIDERAGRELDLLAGQADETRRPANGDPIWEAVLRGGEDAIWTMAGGNAQWTAQMRPIARQLPKGCWGAQPQGHTHLPASRNRPTTHPSEGQVRRCAHPVRADARSSPLANRHPQPRLTPDGRSIHHQPTTTERRAHCAGSECGARSVLRTGRMVRAALAPRRLEKSAELRDERHRLGSRRLDQGGVAVVEAERYKTNERTQSGSRAGPEVGKEDARGLVSKVRVRSSTPCAVGPAYVEVGRDDCGHRGRLTTRG